MIIQYLAAFFTITFSLSCGLTNAWALISFNLTQDAVLSWLAPSLLFIAVTAMNVYIFEEEVLKVLKAIFGEGYLLKGIVTKDGKKLTSTKKAVILIGLGFALAAGITMAALAYQGISNISKGLPDLIIRFPFLQFVSFLCQPAAFLFSSATLVCITSLMFRDIADIVKVDNLGNKLKVFFFNLVSTNRSLPHNNGKTDTRIIIERTITVISIIVLIPLACAGLVMTTKACCTGLAGLVGSNLSKVIAYGFAMTAQVPFTVKTMANAVSKIFDPVKDPKTHATCDSTLKCVGFYFLRLVYALGSGLIAMLGAQSSVGSGIAASGGFANSLAVTSDLPASGTRRIMESIGDKEPADQPNKASDSPTSPPAPEPIMHMSSPSPNPRRPPEHIPEQPLVTPSPSRRLVPA